jgi:hypothetical protein
MKPPAKMPGVSKRAAAIISQLMLEFPEIREGTHMPSIGWMIDSSDERDVVPAPVLGSSKKTDVPSECIVEAYGLALAFVLPTEIEEKYKDSVFDYVHGRFVFVHPSVATWLDK